MTSLPQEISRGTAALDAAWTHITPHVSRMKDQLPSQARLPKVKAARATKQIAAGRSTIREALRERAASRSGSGASNAIGYS